MANFTIAQLEQLTATGQGGVNVTSRDHAGHVTFYSPPPVERDIRRSIYDAVYKVDGWVSRADIAKALVLKKTGWLHDHIEQLVNEGYLMKAETVRYNGMKQYWYAVARLP